MLSTSPEKTAEVVLGKLPNISCESYNTYDGVLVEELLTQISTICSIYHKTPAEMVKLYGIAENSGMISRASDNKIEVGNQMQVEYKKEKALAPIPEVKEKKKKPVDKKAARMDDSSDEEVGKPQNVGMDSSDDEPSSTKQSVTTAPAQVNLIDDLLGMDAPQA